MTRGGTIDAYIDEVSRQFATGAATEHSYRPALRLSAPLRETKPAPSRALAWELFVGGEGGAEA